MNHNIPSECNACHKPLLLKNLYCDDGCPCNSPRGVNFRPERCKLCKHDYCVKPGHRVELIFGLATSQPSGEQTQARCPKCECESWEARSDGACIFFRCKRPDCLHVWSTEFFRPSNPSGSAGAQDEAKTRLITQATLNGGEPYAITPFEVEDDVPEGSAEPAAGAKGPLCECGCGQLAVGHGPTPQSHEADYCTGPCCMIAAEPAVVSAPPESNRCNTCTHPEAVHDRLGCAIIGCNCKQFAAAQPVAADLAASQIKSLNDEVSELRQDCIRLSAGLANPPKVEEVARKIELCIRERIAIGVQHNGLNFCHTEAIAAILAPYFTQVIQPPTELNSLRVIGGKLRMNLKDAATVYPEHFNIESVNQLIAEWDAVVSEVVKEMCASPVAPVSGTEKENNETTIRNEGTRDTRKLGGWIHSEAAAQIKEKIAQGEAGQYEAAILWQELERIQSATVSGNGTEPPVLDRDDLLDLKRIMELLREHDIRDTDVLKHTLEDHDRWRTEILAGAASHNGQGWVSQLKKLRDDGWMVAVHNDYRQEGKHRTFWLFTRVGREGQFVKGEGETDADALQQIIRQLASHALPAPPSEANGPQVTTIPQTMCSADIGKMPVINLGETMSAQIQAAVIELNDMFPNFPLRSKMSVGHRKDEGFHVEFNCLEREDVVRIAAMLHFYNESLKQSEVAVRGQGATEEK